MRRNIVIIGAGHNGLITAFYLSNLGHKVTVVERSATPGGAACNYSMPCGCIVSRGANTFGMLSPEIIKDMSLAEADLKLIKHEPNHSLLWEDGQIFDWFDDPENPATSLVTFNLESPADINRFVRDLSTASDILRESISGRYQSTEALATLMNSTSPGLGDRFVLGSLRDLVSFYFRSEIGQSLAAATTMLYPAKTTEPGTAFPLLYLSLSEINGLPGGAFVVGGMGFLTKKMAEAAAKVGTRIILGNGVRELVTESDRIVSATLESGENIQADIYISNADPISTMRLLKSVHLPPSPHTAANFASMAHKANFILAAPPRSLISAFSVPYRRSVLVLNGSLNQLDQLHDNQDEVPPYVELLYHSLHDPSIVCSSNHHVMSAYILTHESDSSRSNLIEELERRFPGFKDSVIHIDWISPKGIQSIWGMYGGNVDHGNMTPGNRLDSRQGMIELYYKCVQNLYSCGSGSYPGGLVSGYPALYCLNELNKDGIGVL